MTGHLVDNTLKGMPVSGNKNILPSTMNVWKVPENFYLDAEYDKKKIGSDVEQYTATFKNPPSCKYSDPPCTDEQKLCGYLKPDPKKKSEFGATLFSRSYNGQWKTQYKLGRNGSKFPAETTATFMTSYANGGQFRGAKPDPDCIQKPEPWPVNSLAGGTDYGLGYKRQYRKMETMTNDCALCDNVDGPNCKCAMVPDVCLKKSRLNKCKLI